MLYRRVLRVVLMLCGGIWMGTCAGVVANQVVSSVARALERAGSLAARLVTATVVLAALRNVCSPHESTLINIRHESE